MFVVKSCCCCSSLWNGTNIIGFLYLIGHILNIGQRSKHLGDVLSVVGWDVDGSYWWWKFTISASIIDIIFSLILIVLTAFLLRGIRINKRQWVDLWVKTDIVILVLNGILSGTHGYFLLESEFGEELTPGITAAYCAILLIAFAISFYFWLVVYSFSVQLREQEERSQNPAGLLSATGKTTANQHMV